MPSRTLLQFITFAFLALPAAAQSLTGKVVGIADGDTLTILTSQRTQLKVLLDVTDAPEDGHEFSATSKGSRAVSAGGGRPKSHLSSAAFTSAAILAASIFLSASSS